MRKMLVAVIILILAGCNDVHSVRPLIHDADGAPAFRPGLWVGLNKDCPFDAAQPVEQWPGCAGAVMIERSQFKWANKGSKSSVMAYRLTGRLPTIIQMRVMGDHSGRTKSDPSAAKLGPYQYAGLTVLSVDAQGRMTKAEFWTAQCGPPPPQAKPGETPRYVTDTPLPGMTVIGDACTTKSLDAVRAAVIASRDWSMVQELRWVRDQP